MPKSRKANLERASMGVVSDLMEQAIPSAKTKPSTKNKTSAVDAQAKTLSETELAVYVEWVGKELGLSGLHAGQQATLERILSEENSLLRMFCDGRLEEWKQNALAEKPPELISGVLPSPDMTLGADWELPFNRPVVENDPDSNHFDRFFYEQLENRGFKMQSGEYVQEKAGERVMFFYSDKITVTGANEYGLPVIKDTPEGWETYSDIFDAFNAVNQGIDESRMPAIKGYPEKACVDNLLAPILRVNNRTGLVEKRRWTTGIHFHFGLKQIPGLEDTTLSFADSFGEKLYDDATLCTILAEDHVYRLGEHKQFGWRHSLVCHPSLYNYEGDLDETVFVKGNDNLRENKDFSTIQFRPNDTYIETVDTKATMRRAQAQVAMYGGMLWALSKEAREDHDFDILREGKGAGLLTGWTSAGRGAEEMTEEQRKKLAELHFCATLDLFVPSNRTATAKDKNPFELRKLLFYEWATSIEPPQPNWNLLDLVPMPE